MAEELGIRGQIVRWVSDEPQPGIIECRFTDRFGHEWTIVEKTAYVWFAGPMWAVNADSLYPIACLIPGKVVSRIEHEGRIVLTFDTQGAGIETVNGVSRFDLFEDQLGAFDPKAPVDV